MSPGPAIAVLDYGMGNRRSVQKALEHVGARASITRDRDALCGSDGIIVPGVGAFPLAMRNLERFELVELLRERAAAGVPLLGICLGMQLLFDRSEELGSTRGLGLIRGEVRWLATGGLRIPHIGWNEVSFERRSPLIDGLPAEGCPFYHVHSLAVHPSEPGDVIATCAYGERFATIVAHGPVLGVQFHPEKSSARGLAMLRNFAGLCASGSRTSAAAAA